MNRKLANETQLIIIIILILTSTFEVALDFELFLAVVVGQAVLDTFGGTVEVEFGLLVAVVEALLPVSVLAVASLGQQLALVLHGVHLGFGVGVNELGHVDGVFSVARSATIGTDGETNQTGGIKAIVPLVLFVLLLLLLLAVVLAFLLLLLLLILVVVLHGLLFLIFGPVVGGRCPGAATEVLERQTTNVKLLFLLVLVLVPVVVAVFLEMTKMRRRLDDLCVLEEGTALGGVGLDVGRDGDEKESENGLLEHGQRFVWSCAAFKLRETTTIVRFKKVCRPTSKYLRSLEGAMVSGR